MSDKLKNIKAVQEMLEGTHKTQTRINIGGLDSKPVIIRAIGDTWLDKDGNKWEQKQGYKHNYGKNSEAMDAARIYLNTAPSCLKLECIYDRTKKLDVKYRQIHGTCFKCGIEIEQNMKINKTWDSYENKKLITNMESWLVRVDSEVAELIEGLRAKQEVVEEDGSIEKWEFTGDIEPVVQQIQEQAAEAKKVVQDEIDRRKSLETVNEHKE
jgi:hypothetical protein